jgi:hypothetical protein
MNALVRCGALLSMLLIPAAIAAPEDVRIYEPGMLTRDRYEIVGRLWVDSWRSAFEVPTHAERSEAIAALRSEAAQRGANALTNVACLVNDAPLAWSGPHFCYALAIRVR